MHECIMYIRANSRLVLSQWETSLQNNAVSHWLGANLESPLHPYICAFSHVPFLFCVGNVQEHSQFHCSANNPCIWIMCESYFAVALTVMVYWLHMYVRGVYFSTTSSEINLYLVSNEMISTIFKGQCARDEWCNVIQSQICTREGNQRRKVYRVLWPCSHNNRIHNVSV